MHYWSTIRHYIWFLIHSVSVWERLVYHFGACWESPLGSSRANQSADVSHILAVLTHKTCVCCITAPIDHRRKQHLSKSTFVCSNFNNVCVALKTLKEGALVQHSLWLAKWSIHCKIQTLCFSTYSSFYL